MNIMPFAPTNSEVRTRGDCPICGGVELLSSVTFDALPVLCNALHSNAAAARATGIWQFATIFCHSCGHVFNAVGFDKSFDMTRNDAVPGVCFVNDWFGDTYTDVQPDFMSCRHVIEHIAEPVAFLRALRAHPGIEPETVFYFEAPNALYTLRDLGIWDLIYEHVPYFTPPSLRTAFEAAGFEVLDMGTAYGEQYLSIEAKPSFERPLAHSSQIGEIKSLVRDFNSAYCDKIRRRRHYFASQDPGRAIVWGAGSKGVTFINVVPGADRIGALVDVNPHKQGRFAPRIGIPILAPEALRGQPVDSVIIMNPLYHGEIARAVAGLGLSPEIVVA